MVQITDPIDLLHELEGRARRMAFPLPQGVEIRESWEGIGFRIAQMQLITPIGQVAEILTEFRVTPVPGVKPWVYGVANVRGLLLPILDLAGLLGKVATKPMNRMKLLIIQHNGMSAGMCVDDVLGMRHFYSEEFSRQTGIKQPGILHLLDGAYTGSGGVALEQEDNSTQIWPIINLYRLMEQNEFRDIAM